MISYKLCEILLFFLIHNTLIDIVHGQHQKGSINYDDSNDEFEGCYDGNTNPYLLFATKTSYKTIVREEQDIIQPSPGNYFNYALMIK